MERTAGTALIARALRTTITAMSSMSVNPRRPGIMIARVRCCMQASNPPEGRLNNQRLLAVIAFPSAPVLVVAVELFAQKVATGGEALLST